MSTNCPPTELHIADLPLFVRADLYEPPLVRRSWVWTIAPAYAGVFVWIPILDRLGTCLPGQTSLGWLAATAVLAVLACCFLLYDIPAMWGWTAGHRLGVVGASTFGTTGSEWMTSVVVGLGALAYYAVSVKMAINLIMLGLLSCGLIDPSVFKPWSLGPLVLQSPVILLTALFWIYIITVVCRLRMAGVIFALMQVYTPVALSLLGATALLASAGLPDFAAAKESLAQLDPVLSSQVEPNGAHLFQLIFGGFALSGLMGVEWGMAVSRRSDVRIGGWIGIILAGSFCAVMALLTVAGAGPVHPRRSPDRRRVASHPALVPLGRSRGRRRNQGRRDSQPFRPGHDGAGVLLGLDFQRAYFSALASDPPQSLDPNRWPSGLCLDRDLLGRSSRRDLQPDGSHLRTCRRRRGC